MPRTLLELKHDSLNVGASLNLQLQIKFVNAERPDGAYLSALPTPECEVLNMETHSFGHKYLHEPDSLRADVSAAGFRDIQLADVGVS